jgi:methylated-DNA-[protein]-cysteine S-methyltransferase
MSDIEAVLERGPGPDDGYDDLVEAAVARAAAEGAVDVAWVDYDAPTGTHRLVATEQGLLAVSLLDLDGHLELIARQVSPRIVRLPARLDPVRRQLDEYFAGQRHEFDLPLDWALSRGFRRAVLDELAKVPYGQIVTYLDLAGRAGNPKASRAVGSAMATNPLPIVVPCHRVIRTDGSLGGYGGGLPMKQHLLALEGATLNLG